MVEKFTGPKKLKFWASSPTAVRRQVDILELKDLEKEYILSRSRLTLAQHHPPSAAIAGTPEIYAHTHLSTHAFFFHSDNQNLKSMISQSAAIAFCAGSASAVEMVALLVQNGLFDCAVSVCQTFKLSLAPVFEGLTFK